MADLSAAGADLAGGPTDLIATSDDLSTATDGPASADLAQPSDLTTVPPADLRMAMTTKVGPGGMPFPDPGQAGKNVDKDNNGFVGLTATRANFDFLWVAGDQDWNIGSVTKIDTKNVKEVARYFSVTCYSNPMGSRAKCDGIAGCCSADDYVSYQNRKMGKPSGAHQSVDLIANRPSRTSVDYNGDMWVANRAFAGQASVTKIANDIGSCRDRNGVPGIQTSSDVNGDGVIDTDCNRDMVPDDIANVKGNPCVNKLTQEFFGYDDECVLFTTNTNLIEQANPPRYPIGRPIALGKGNLDGTPSDLWAGSYRDGKFFRVDGTTGLVKADAQLPKGSAPYGATIDAKGILWATNLGGGLYYFDTNIPAMAGAARRPDPMNSFALGGYGITMDRDQNVWVAGTGPGSWAEAYRYTPDRSKGFAELGTGYWTRVALAGKNTHMTPTSGRGIAGDARNDKVFFVWMALTSGWVVRLDASTIPLPQGIDKTVDGSAMPAIQVAGGATAGAGVDADQNVWGVSGSGSVATRIKVDPNGNPTKPDIAMGADNQGCPVGSGDRCTLGLKGTMSDPRPYTYSDFTGFGLRNFTLPKGIYTYLQKGCPMGSKTIWRSVTWDADLPAKTTVSVRARSGNTAQPDQTWGAWTGDYTMSPASLLAKPGPLAVNPADHIQIEFTLATADQTMSPKLKTFDVTYFCQ